jgi:hypothetical protein
MKTIKEHIDLIRSLEEGETGAKIGGAIGSLIGQKDAGAKIGSNIGDTLHNIFHSGSKTVVSTQPANDDSSHTGYVAAGPDGSTMMNVTPPPGGFRKSSGDSRKDKFGNTADDYKPQPKVVSVTANLSLPKGGSGTSEMQKIESGRGTGLKVLESWDTGGGTLALMAGDATNASSGGCGIWVDKSTSATMGTSDEMPNFYKKLGYKLIKDFDTRTRGSLGNLLVQTQEMSKGILSSNVVYVQAFQNFAFESPQGKGLHTIQASYLGSTRDYERSGKKQLQQLCDSMKPASNIKPLG